MLALEITTVFHNSHLAMKAQDEFNTIFSKKNNPTHLNSMHVQCGSWICKVLVDLKFAPSSSQARRDIKAGALSINQEKQYDENFKFLQEGEFILKLGKRKFAKIIVVK